MSHDRSLHVTSLPFRSAVRRVHMVVSLLHITMPSIHLVVSLVLITMSLDHVLVWAKRAPVGHREAQGRGLPTHVSRCLSQMVRSVRLVLSTLVMLGSSLSKARKQPKAATSVPTAIRGSNAMVVS